MNYVILNGVKSTDINGLIIQSLPPITKPMMRTEIQQIDGRDGDIVTKLGYSAYDKEVLIGLRGNYDVDDVIRYFNSEGTVTFSNEPDKIYNYQIIEQIDFEKLLRFKKATVTFHVQPFKISTSDNKYVLKNQYIDFDDWTKTDNGLTLTAENGVISISGVCLTFTEFYVPIKGCNLGEGDYTLTAKASGTGYESCQIRVVNDIPNDGHSFGGDSLALGPTVTLTDEIEDGQSYNYLWVFVMPSAVNFSFTADLVGDVSSISLINRGNVYSRPIVTIRGSGTVLLAINNVNILAIYLGDYGYITIDAVQMNAYHGSYLMNRLVIGDYTNLALRIGKNTISWTGNVTGVEVENFSRWI